MKKSILEHPIVGGGKMGDLIRSFDWNATSMGDPPFWHQSLVTTLNLLLNSRFPKYLFWGKELIGFYNDAYRPSLGNQGKHPGILGMAGEVAWPEIWDQIKPMLDQVLSGSGATWMEDALIPIFRNNRMEDVYWTFSYSPAFDDTGSSAGVLVTCIETTDKVESIRTIKEQARILLLKEQFLENITSASPAALWMADELGRATYFNETWIKWTGVPIERHLADGWTDYIYSPDREKVVRTYMTAFKQRESFNFDFRLVRSDGTLMWSTAQGAARFSIDGLFLGYAGSCVDSSERIKSQQIIEKHVNKLEAQVAERTKELEKRAMQLSRAQDIARMASWEWFFENDEIIWSPEMYKFWGYSVGEIAVSMKHVVDSTFPEDLPLLSEVIEKVRSGHDTEIEYRRFDRKGNLLFISTKIKVLFDEANNPIGAFGIDLDLTKQKGSENQLSQLNRELQSAHEIARIGSWRFHFDTNKQEWSEGLYKLFGFVEGEISFDDDSYGNVHPEDIEYVKKMHQQIRQDREPLEFEFRRINKQKEIINVISKGRVDKIVKGEVQSIIGINMDVTDLRTKEQELRDSLKFNKYILDILPNVIYVYDLDKKEYIFSNRNIFGFLGYSQETIDSLGHQVLFTLLHPKDKAIVEEHFDSFADTTDETVKECEYRCQDQNGKYRYLLSRDAVYKRNNNGRVIQIIGTLLDITASKEASLHLEEVNHLLSVKNRGLEQQVLTEFSDSFASYKTGMDFFQSLSQDLIEKTQLDYLLLGTLKTNEDNQSSFTTLSFLDHGNLHDRDPVSVDLEPLREVLKGHQILCIKHSSDQYPESDLIINYGIEACLGIPLFDNEQNVLGAILVMHKKPIDNVAYVRSLMKVAAKRFEFEIMRLEHEEELAQKNARLESQNKDLASFNHVVSHDLREPIRKIQMFVSRINAGDSNLIPDMVSKYIDRIGVATVRMQTLIEDLLTFSSITQKSDLYEEVDLAELLSECLVELQDQVSQKNARIHFEKLPTIYGVPFQLRQLLDNILRNALKYTKDQRDPVINIAVEILSNQDVQRMEVPLKHRSYFHFTFSDNGIGFDPAFAKEIFIPFKRLHSRETYPGSGIGLATCMKIVQNHKGAIVAEGVVGKGSTFHVYLPDLR